MIAFPPGNACAFGGPLFIEPFVEHAGAFEHDEQHDAYDKSHENCYLWIHDATSLVCSRIGLSCLVLSSICARAGLNS